MGTPGVDELLVSRVPGADCGGVRGMIRHLDLVTQKAVFNAMRRHGIKARNSAKRDQRGPKNHMWKGDEASYGAMHIRLYARFGRVNECSVCGTNDPSKWYDWANLTGRYEDINDYQRMCRSCHRQYDKRRTEGGDAK